MMNWIWLVLIGASVIAGICTGTIGAVQDNLFSFADTAVELALGLIGVMAFFCGLMKIMEEAGLCEKLGQAISPVMKHLFPGVPKDHPANSAIAMYIAASVLGLGNACTPSRDQGNAGITDTKQNRKHRYRCTMYGYGNFYRIHYPDSNNNYRNAYCSTGRRCR